METTSFARRTSIVPLAGDDGEPLTVYVKVLAVAAVMVNVPLYWLWLAPLIFTFSPNS